MFEKGHLRKLFSVNHINRNWGNLEKCFLSITIIQQSQIMMNKCLNIYCLVTIYFLLFHIYFHPLKIIAHFNQTLFAAALKKFVSKLGTAKKLFFFNRHHFNGGRSKLWLVKNHNKCREKIYLPFEIT